MGGFLVRGLGLRRAVSLDQDEARGIIGVLHDIEARDTGFADAGAGIGKRRRLEDVDAVGFHLNMDENDQHGREAWRRSRVIPSAIGTSGLGLRSAECGIQTSVGGRIA